MQITQAFLREIYNYDPITGCLTYKKKRRGVRVGKVVGKLTHGYLVSKLFGRWYRVHRLIWILNKGDIPKGLVADHIDFDRSNNRLENLQLLTVRANALRRRKPVRGIYRHTQIDRWCVRAMINGVRRYYGSYKTEQEALAAYVALIASTKGGSFAMVQFP